MKTVKQLVKEQRDSGATLEEIGKSFGCCRENIRLILVKNYGTADVRSLGKTVFTTSQLADVANCSPSQIMFLYTKGVITPLNWSPIKKFWSLETLGILLRARSCRICGTILPKGRSVFCCNSCRVEGGKYKHRSDELKRRHRGYVRHWLASHPERAKEIQRAAMRRYLVKRRTAV